MNKQRLKWNVRDVLEPFELAVLVEVVLVLLSSHPKVFRESAHSLLDLS